MNTDIQLGVSTFGDVPHRPGEERLSDAATIREVVDHGVLAEELGMDVFAVGEHHRDDMPVSAPDMVLATIAGRTQSITLSTAVTVLSTDDPVRVHERFATLDAVSGGRAEPILGRGSFTETFPLFGYDLADYDELFEEKLDLFAQLRAEAPISWSGRHRPALADQDVWPKTEAGLRTWVGVGGNPQSVVRAARYGFNLMLAGLGQTPERITQYVQLYEAASAKFGQPRGLVGVSAGGYVAETDEAARTELWPEHRARMDRIGESRGWAPMTRESYELTIDQTLHLVGSPQTVAQRMSDLALTTGIDRLVIGYDTRSLPLDNKVTSLTLLGREVFPQVRAAVAAGRQEAA